MTRKKTSNKLLVYAKKWYVLGAAIAITFTVFYYVMSAIDGHIKSVAEDMVREKLAAYPSAEAIKEIKTDVGTIKLSIVTMDKNISAIDGYIRAKENSK
jgi:hypothetical protein